MKAYIFDRVYIPGLGMGPFYTPVEVPDVRMIKTISAISSNYKFIFDEDNIELPVNPPVSDAIIEDVVETVEDETIIEDVVETVEDETIIEDVVDPVKIFTEEELKELTVEELKDVLEACGIDFLYKDKKSILISKYLEHTK